MTKKEIAYIKGKIKYYTDGWKEEEKAGRKATDPEEKQQHYRDSDVLYIQMNTLESLLKALSEI